MKVLDNAMIIFSLLAGLFAKLEVNVNTLLMKSI